MTFTKYVALMLLGFALFVGYRAYAKHTMCAGLRSTLGEQETMSERQRALDKYKELCGSVMDAAPWF